MATKYFIIHGEMSVKVTNFNEDEMSEEDIQDWVMDDFSMSDDGSVWIEEVDSKGIRQPDVTIDGKEYV